jgi:hypothetical protein
MDNEILFCISDPHGYYTMGQIATLLEIAQNKGYPLEPGSYLESMTVKQLARLVSGMHDC